MITMIESGSLGNQIFQYLALEGIRKPNERMLLFGFDQLNTTLDLPSPVNFVHIQTNVLKHLFSLDYNRVGRFQRKLRAFQVVGEDTTGMVDVPKASRLRLVEPSWFQNPAAFQSPSSHGLAIKSEILQRSLAEFERLGFDPQETIVLHVRAGDYRTWPSVELPAILTPDWYQRQVRALRDRDPNLKVVAVGNEPEYISEVLEEIPDSVDLSSQLQNDYRVDFGALSLCKYSVISASTFSLWARYFAHSGDSNAISIAPKFWAGHAARDWYPANLQVDFLNYR
jgi:hypothetical protein